MSDIIEYPPDWPCKCKHPLKFHGFAVYDNACLLLKNGKISEVPFPPHDMYQDSCEHFKPIDNLTYVEQLAKAKKVLK
jgi:hypothetical protein